MLIAVVPLVVALVGLLMFVLCKGDAKSIGLALFTAAMTALMIAMSGKYLRIG